MKSAERLVSSNCGFVSFHHVYYEAAQYLNVCLWRSVALNREDMSACTQKLQLRSGQELKTTSMFKCSQFTDIVLQEFWAMEFLLVMIQVSHLWGHRMQQTNRKYKNQILSHNPSSVIVTHTNLSTTRYGDPVPTGLRGPAALRGPDLWLLHTALKETKTSWS